MHLPADQPHILLRDLLLPRMAPPEKNIGIRQKLLRQPSGYTFAISGSSLSCTFSFHTVTRIIIYTSAAYFRRNAADSLMQSV